MHITVEPIDDAAAKSNLCAEITAQLPMWFGRPETNARYINVWWLGVSPTAHRRDLGKALVARAAEHLTRRLYEAVGFAPFVESEPESGDHMMWMLREL